MEVVNEVGCDLFKQLEFVKAMKSYIDQEVIKLRDLEVEAPYSSQDVSNLALALSKAQGSFKDLKFNRTNPYLDLQYADNSNILKAIREALSKNELALTQFISTPDNGSSILHTRLIHSSGQWMETRVRLLPPKNDISSFESTLNSQKRFSTMALLAIAPDYDPGDDDGEIAMIDANKFIAKGPSEKNDPRKQSANVITKREVEEFERELDGYPELAENLLEHLRIRSIADMPASQYRSTMIRLRKIKEDMEKHQN